jgi:23S rRNA (adenine-N6)-dimethyltransferase
VPGRHGTKRPGTATRWGFHRLRPQWAERLVDEAGIRAGELVLDIGAGDGALTAPLVARGARVIAFELHDARADRLRARFADDDVTVVRADAIDLRLPRRPFAVVANPPFAATSAILRRLTSPGSRLVRADLLVTRHVAARWSGGRGWADDRFAASMRSLPRRALQPCPPHDVAVLRLIDRNWGRQRGPWNPGEGSVRRRW